MIDKWLSVWEVHTVHHSKLTLHRERIGYNQAHLEDQDRNWGRI